MAGPRLLASPRPEPPSSLTSPPSSPSSGLDAHRVLPLPFPDHDRRRQSSTEEEDIGERPSASRRPGREASGQNRPACAARCRPTGPRRRSRRRGVELARRESKSGSDPSGDGTGGRGRRRRPVGLEAGRRSAAATSGEQAGVRGAEAPKEQAGDEGPPTGRSGGAGSADRLSTGLVRLAMVQTGLCDASARLSKVPTKLSMVPAEVSTVPGGHSTVRAGVQTVHAGPQPASVEDSDGPSTARRRAPEPISAGGRRTWHPVIRISGTARRRRQGRSPRSGRRSTPGPAPVSPK